MTQNSSIIQKDMTGFIINTVCNYNEVTPLDLISKKQNRPVSESRFIIYYIIKRLYKKTTLYYLGGLFRQDHSNVTYGIKTIKKLLSIDKTLNIFLLNLEDSILSRRLSNEYVTNIFYDKYLIDKFAIRKTLLGI